MYYSNSGVEQTAAELIARVVSQATGESYIAKRTTATVSADNDIFIGELSGISTADLGTEDGQVTMAGSNIAITGGGDRGVLYGAYRFLEDYYGYRQYTKDLEVIPEAAAVVSTVETKTYTQTFEYRETDFFTTDYDNVTGAFSRYSAQDFRVANGLNGQWTYATIDEAHGGMFGSINHLIHPLASSLEWPSAILSSTTYFDSNPEWFALEKATYFWQSGTRTSEMICLSSAGALAKAKEEVLALCKTQSNTSPYIITIGKSDNNVWCECDDCDGEDESALLLTFVNNIADAVKEAGYTNARLMHYAYYDGRHVPTDGIVPRDNVVVMYIPINACYGHAIDDSTCSTNASYLADLKAWNAITDNLYVWSYGTNYTTYNSIYPDFQALRQTIKAYADNGVTGVYVQGPATEIIASNSEFGELRSYLISRMLLNPNMTEDEYNTEMKGFIKAYYGSEYLYDFIQLINSHATVDMSIYEEPTALLQSLKSSTSDLATANGYWTSAINATAEGSTQRDRVLCSQLSWRFWMACNSVSGYSGSAVNEALYADFVTYGITMYSENRLLKASTDISWSDSPTTWKGDARY